MFPSRPRPSRTAVAVTAAVAVVLGIVGVVALRSRSDDPDRVATAVRATTTLAGTPAAPAVAPTSPTGIDGGSSVTTTTGLTTTTARPGAASPGSAPPTTAVDGSGGGGPGGGGSGGVRLRLDTNVVNFGTTSTEMTATIGNSGGVPIGWSVESITPSAFSASPTSGTLPPRTSTQVTVYLDRGAAPEGTLEGRLQFASDFGAGYIALRASIGSPPSVRATIDPETLGAPPCSTPPAVASVRAEASDESGIRSVVLHWASDQAGSGSRPLTPTGAGTWGGQLGPFSQTAAVLWWVQATDNAGRTNQPTPSRISVVSC